MTDNIWLTCALVPGLTKSECAAWVQAWGSIGALALAVGLARVEASRRRREAKAAQADAIEAAFHAFQMAVGFVRAASEPLRHSVDAMHYARIHNSHMMDELALMMASIPVHTLGTQGMRSMVRARVTFSSARTAIDGAVKGLLAGTIVPGTSDLRLLLSTLDEEVEIMAAACIAAGRIPNRKAK